MPDEGSKGPKFAIVKTSQLGLNCWKPARLIEGVRCERVMECKYPEKATCKAVEAEMLFLLNDTSRQIKEIAVRNLAKINQLREERAYDAKTGNEKAE